MKVKFKAPGRYISANQVTIVEVTEETVGEVFDVTPEFFFYQRENCALVDEEPDDSANDEVKARLLEETGAKTEDEKKGKRSKKGDAGGDGLLE